MLRLWKSFWSPVSISSAKTHSHAFKDNQISERKAFSLPEEGQDDEKEAFDVILLCHSLYGLNPKQRWIERTPGLLKTGTEGATLVAFHRDSLQLIDLVCHKSAVFPTGTFRVRNDDETLDRLAALIAGGNPPSPSIIHTRGTWRATCRSMGRRTAAYPEHLEFRAPEIMMAFTRHATSLPELTAIVPMARSHGQCRTVKCVCFVLRLSCARAMSAKCRSAFAGLFGIICH
jgi:hypothetical protein